jgi:hypothetical protein
LGGGQKVEQTNPAQAAASNAAATGAAQGAQSLSNKFSGQQQQLFNNLWGTPGAGGKPGTGGALTGMLDPSKLNVTSPTGPYGLMFTKQKEQLAKSYQDAAGATTRNLAQSGFGPGTPSGFGASLQAENARGLANATGDAYAGATDKSYQDQLANFWKAAEAANGGSATAGQGALAGNNTANQTYSNLYGTAGHGNVLDKANYFGPLMGAAGTLGAAALTGGASTAAQAGGGAMCCAEGTLVRTGLKEVTPIEKLFEGATVFGLPEYDDDPLVIKQPLAFAMKACVRIKTDDGRELICSTDHALVTVGGGFAMADESLNHAIRTRDGSVKVVDVKHVGERRVVRLHLEAPHVFEANGLLSEE